MSSGTLSVNSSFSWLPSNLNLLSTGANANLEVFKLDGIAYRDLLFENNEKYKGGWRNDKPEGEGRYVWSDGSIYEGSWHQGLKHGWGKYTWPNGTSYLGEWRSGHLQGHGTLESADGSRYQGSWHNNLKHGYGSKWYTNGDRYEGLWSNGSCEGPGRYVWANGNEFDGEWRSGKMHGQGTLKWKSGHRYDGEWLEGVEDGIGVFTWPDGSTFEGFWSRGRKNGVGVFRPATGTKHQHHSSHQQHQHRAFAKGISAAGEVPLSPMAAMNNYFNGANNSVGSAGTTQQQQQKTNAQHAHRPSLEDPVESPKAQSSNRPADAALSELKGSTGGDTVYICEYADGTLIHEETLSSEDIQIVFGTPFYPLNSLGFDAAGALGFSAERGGGGAAAGRQSKFGRRGRRPRREQRLGETIFKGHRSFDLMLNLQLGIRYTIGALSKLPLPRQLGPAHFEEKIWLRFPREGSEVTPPHPSNDFKWKDYCPTAFRRLREIFGVDDSQYIRSICGDQALRELPSPGKSGSVFFLSQDDRFIIKTMRKEEVSLLLTALPKYVAHVAANPDTLLTRFYGVHRVKPSQGRKVRFVVMTNIFRSDIFLHRKFDLKGSTYKRTAGPWPNSATVGKDLDLDATFQLQPKLRETVMRQLSLDCGFLEGVQVMDYSLLLGVHYKNVGPGEADAAGAALTDVEDEGGITTADEGESPKAPFRSSSSRSAGIAGSSFLPSTTHNIQSIPLPQLDSSTTLDPDHHGTAHMSSTTSAFLHEDAESVSSLTESTAVGEDLDLQVTRSMRSSTMSIAHLPAIDPTGFKSSKSGGFGIRSFISWRRQQGEKRRQLKHQRQASFGAGGQQHSFTSSVYDPVGGGGAGAEGLPTIPQGQQLVPELIPQVAGAAGRGNSNSVAYSGVSGSHQEGASTYNLLLEGGSTTKTPGPPRSPFQDSHNSTAADGGGGGGHGGTVQVHEIGLHDTASSRPLHPAGSSVGSEEQQLQQQQQQQQQLHSQPSLGLSASATPKVTHHRHASTSLDGAFVGGISFNQRLAEQHAALVASLEERAALVDALDDDDDDDVSSRDVGLSHDVFVGVASKTAPAASAAHESGGDSMRKSPLGPGMKNQKSNKAVAGASNTTTLFTKEEQLVEDGNAHYSNTSKQSKHAQHQQQQQGSVLSHSTATSSVNWRSDAVALPGAEDNELESSLVSQHDVARTIGNLPVSPGSVTTTPKYSSLVRSLSKTKNSQHQQESSSKLVTVTSFALREEDTVEEEEAYSLADVSTKGRTAVDIASGRKIRHVPSMSADTPGLDAPTSSRNLLHHVASQSAVDLLSNSHNINLDTPSRSITNKGLPLPSPTALGPAAHNSGVTLNGRELHRSESAPASTLCAASLGPGNGLHSGGGGAGLRSERSYVDLTSPEATAVASQLSSKLSRPIDNNLLQELLRLARYRILQPRQAGGGGGGGVGQFRPPTTVLAARHERRGSNNPPPAAAFEKQQQQQQQQVEMGSSRTDDLINGIAKGINSGYGTTSYPVLTPTTTNEAVTASNQGIPGIAVARFPDKPPLVGSPLGEEVVVYMGLIDWLQPYNMRKKLEHGYKAVVQDSRGISVIEPKAYAKRFLKFMNQVFVRSPSMSSTRK